MFWINGRLIEKQYIIFSHYFNCNNIIEMEMRKHFYLIIIALSFFSINELIAQESDTSFFYELGLTDLNSESQELVSIGTRTDGYLQLESLVPIDIILASDLSSSPQIELSQILTYLLSSFNANHQTISDGTDHIVPASLRGLGPDQVLVFVNGKRRHSSALVNVNGTFGRGAVNTDFDAIPVAAIKRIEILRDGASAQYGSDAIAGVINIVLKDNIGIESSVFTGRTIEGDGIRNRVDINYGVKIGTKGFLNVTGEVLHRGSTNRAGEYTGTIYHADDEEDNTDPRTSTFDRRNMIIGNAQANTGKLYYNLSVPLRQLAEFYSFGGVSFRQSKATGFYRYPKNEEKVVLELHENGFLPEIHAPITDKSFSFGIRQVYKKWDIDLSTTYGNNDFDFKIKNSNNASMGINSPLNFYCGGFRFSQITTNLDISQSIRNIRGVNRLNIAFGGEFRLDNYSIISGEDASYIDGGMLTSDGNPRLPGAQVFSGFQKQNELDENRYSSSFYVDVEAKINEKFTVELASNFVNYSDWGNNISGKFAARYKLWPFLYVRSGVSTGFRSSSLHQSYSTNVSTQIIDGQSYQVGTFNNNSLVTKAFGFPELTEEEALNHSFGIIILPAKKLVITADYYLIYIYNRIVLSGRFNSTDGYEIAQILEPFGVNSAQFFTNAINTRTLGGNLDATYDFDINDDLSIRLKASINISQNKIVGDINTSEKLKGNEEILFNREERSRIESALPNDKLILHSTLNYKKIGGSLKTIRFGEVKYIHPTNFEQDQVFTPKWITNISLFYNITERINFSVGGSNIFNVYPDEHTNNANTGSGEFIYSRRVTQFGFNGAFYYTSLKIIF
jgi:iron complex outermembrane receptor protein